MKTTILLFSVIALIALWNGYVIRWFLTKDEKYSKIWHGIGFMVRALLCATLYLQAGLLLALIAAFVCWLPYNVIINLVNKWPMFYVGKSSKIDLLIRRVFFFINFDK